jgi:DNA polymerase-3 subunit epsilon
MRQIVLDTETTGLSPASGHRIVELACIELVDRKKTENRFHHYLNPERESDLGALKVHGLSTMFLADKPKFSEVVDSFVEFVRGAELVIHNAPFDMGFINSELKFLGMPPLNSICASVCDTLPLARQKHPGKKNSLDALCVRYQVDNAHRNLHGALLDADLLAEVFLRMTNESAAS